MQMHLSPQSSALEASQAPRAHRTPRLLYRDVPYFDIRYSCARMHQESQKVQSSVSTVSAVVQKSGHGSRLAVAFEPLPPSALHGRYARLLPVKSPTDELHARRLSGQQRRAGRPRQSPRSTGLAGSGRQLSYNTCSWSTPPTYVPIPHATLQEYTGLRSSRLQWS